MKYNKSLGEKFLFIYIQASEGMIVVNKTQYLFECLICYFSKIWFVIVFPDVLLVFWSSN